MTFCLSSTVKELTKRSCETAKYFSTYDSYERRKDNIACIVFKHEYIGIQIFFLYVFGMCETVHVQGFCNVLGGVV